MDSKRLEEQDSKTGQKNHFCSAKKRIDLLIFPEDFISLG